jgi:hypothetical protein
MKASRSNSPTLNRSTTSECGLTYYIWHLAKLQLSLPALPTAHSLHEAFRFLDELQSSVKSCKQVIDLDHASVQHSLHRMGAMSRLDATASSFTVFA